MLIRMLKRDRYFLRLAINALYWNSNRIEKIFWITEKLIVILR